MSRRRSIDITHGRIEFTEFGLQLSAPFEELGPPPPRSSRSAATARSRRADGAGERRFIGKSRSTRAGILTITMACRQDVHTRLRVVENRHVAVSNGVENS